MGVEALEEVALEEVEKVVVWKEEVRKEAESMAEVVMVKVEETAEEEMEQLK